MAIEGPSGANSPSQATGLGKDASVSKGGGATDASHVHIIDIRTETDEHSILEDIQAGLRPKDGEQKSLPTMLLYDEAGLKLFEAITYLEQYYLTNAEIEVLETYADNIADRIESGSVVVELGSGNLRKVNILLQALDRAGKDVDYYALDLSLNELRRTLSAIPADAFKHVKCSGLHGTYDDGLKWVQTPEIITKPKTILWLGSSIGNFGRADAASFATNIQRVLQPGDSLLVGIDHCKEPEKVYHAYNDRDGVTHSFILNGLHHANRLLGKGAFDLDHWEVIGAYDAVGGRHHAAVAPKKDVEIDGVLIKRGEHIHFEESFKYSALETSHLWESAGLVENIQWTNSNGKYGLHMASKPAVIFPLRPEGYAATPAPSFSDWKKLWTAWDIVSQQMIPKEELLSKPIKLRNACIFYLGHIPTFLDIHLTRATNGQPTEPAHYQKIFERGIDPDVDDPKKCHNHSEIPDEWPPVEEILAFQQRVRDRVGGLYDSGVVEHNQRIARAMWFTFEHEAMHMETILYMLIQSDKTLPPAETITPDFKAMARLSDLNKVENEWFIIPDSDFTIGLNDPDDDLTSVRYFGWDNEKPERKASVKSFSAKARPITNGEYAHYLEETGISKLPAAWAERSSFQQTLNSIGSNGAEGGVVAGASVRTVYGNVPLKYAMNWPVFASYDELAACAQWMGGRIPTANEVRSIYNYVEAMTGKDFANALDNTIPAVNSHLVNDGVEETPPQDPSLPNFSETASGLRPQSLFTNLEGTNVGFRHWHPVSVVEHGGKLCGQADFGGTWEWTSTVLEKYEGFEPMKLYPGYTADFFDGKHNIVLGGSWATHPRIAGRKTFVNWFQRNYPYTWAGARVVRDL